MIERDQQVNWPARMRREMRPEHGDIIISRVDDQPDSCGLSVVPSPDQIRCPTYDEALARAKRFAARAGVDVWVQEDEYDFALISRHRTAVRQRAN